MRRISRPVVRSYRRWQTPRRERNKKEARMNKPPVRLLVLILAVAFARPAAAQQSKAQSQPWCHAIIEAKSDAGIFFMPFKGGFAS